MIAKLPLYACPNEKEFWSWTNRQRHQFIKRGITGEMWKSFPPYRWLIQLYNATNLAVMFQVDKKGLIIRVETTDYFTGIKEVAELEQKHKDDLNNLRRYQDN